MGNNRFRLSDMIPNAWFYKLRDMSSKTRSKNSSKKKTQNQNQTKSNISQPRQSYYYTRDSITNKSYKLYNSPANSTNSHFLDPPRRSCRRRTRRKTVYRPSPVEVTAPGGGATASVSVCTCGGAEFHGCSPFAEFDDLFQSPTSEFDSDNVCNVPQSFNGLASWSSSGSCTFSSSTTDIVLDVNKKSGGYATVVPELDLPPILTKPPAGKSRNLAGKSRNSETEEGLLCFKEEIGGGRSRNPAGNSRNLAAKSRNSETEEGLLCFKEESVGGRSRKSFSGVKLRVNSPKIGSRKIQGYSGRKSVSSGKRSTAAAKRKSFSGSFAVVKASFDPEKDFKESMMEMIVENNIKASKDLEDLLACYLSLNSDGYHGLIIKAFQQIWFNLSDLHL